MPSGLQKQLGEGRAVRSFGAAASSSNERELLALAAFQAAEQEGRAGSSRMPPLRTRRRARRG
eukprot:7331297-Alexandrium_andersonii.AAC.1